MGLGDAGGDDTRRRTATATATATAVPLAYPAIFLLPLPLPLSADDIRAVLEPFESARPFPPDAYLDESVLAFERDAIFATRSWLCVGREDEIPEPGQWLLAPLTDEGILVVRGADGAIRAFYNVCPHRGSTLVAAPSGWVGPTARIECPYHGFAFGLDGARLGRDDRFPGLSQVKVGALAGFLFVSLDDEAPEISGALADGAPPWLAELPQLRRVRRVRWETRANWKLCVENFQESHHFSRVHPSLEALTPCDRSTSVLGDGPWFTGIMDIVPGVETVSKSGRRCGRPFVASEDMRRRVFDAHLFPGMLFSLQPDYLLTYRVHPRAVDRTDIIADTYVHAACPDGADLADVFDFWDVVNAEDRAICERQQVGVASRGYYPSAYADSEDGMHAFDRLVARRYALSLCRPSPEPEPSLEPDSSPARSRLWGIWGRPYINLSGDIDIASFPELDEEIAYGLACVETTRTGGSLKWMNVVAPWVHDDGYLDYGRVIEAFTREEFERFVSLAEDPDAFDPDRRSGYRFGDETDHPLTPAQVRYLLYRHRVYFPWRDAYHLLENDRWEDKHSGAGKGFSDEARRVFPKTVAFIKALPFTEIGRAVIFGLEANDHAPLHRDTEPGVAMSIAQSISFSPRGNKRLYLVAPDGGSQTIVRAPIYWFNDMDYHGVLPDPFWRYSIRVDGVFDAAWVRALEKKHR
jgi:Rieske 2Fe-2S family protein